MIKPNWQTSALKLLSVREKIRVHCKYTEENKLSVCWRIQQHCSKLFLGIYENDGELLICHQGDRYQFYQLKHFNYDSFSWLLYTRRMCSQGRFPETNLDFLHSTVRCWVMMILSTMKYGSMTLVCLREKIFVNGAPQIRYDHSNRPKKSQRLKDTAFFSDIDFLTRFMMHDLRYGCVD